MLLFCYVSSQIMKEGTLT